MNKKTVSSPNNIRLEYWGMENPNVIKSIINDFEEQNPNIKVRYTKQDVKQYRERLITRIQNGNGPDIFNFYNTWTSMLSNFLIPLPQDVITRSDFEKNYYKIAKEDLIKNGAIYGIPLDIDTISLFVNKDLFNAADLTLPNNWIDFVNTAEKLTVNNEDGTIATAGAGLGTFDNITHAPDIISLFLVQNGADLINLANTSQEASDALNFYTSFALDKKVWDSSFESSIKAFSQGRLAMYFGYFSDYPVIKAADPSFKLEIIPVPKLPDQDVTIATFWAGGVSAKSTHKEAALLFVKFLTDKTVLQKIYAEQVRSRGFGNFYPRMDLSDSFKNDVIFSPFVLQSENSKSSFFEGDTLDNGLNDNANKYLKAAINSILSGVSSQNATDALSKGVSQVLQQFPFH